MSRGGPGHRCCGGPWPRPLRGGDDRGGPGHRLSRGPMALPRLYRGDMRVRRPRSPRGLERRAGCVPRSGVAVVPAPRRGQAPRRGRVPPARRRCRPAVRRGQIQTPVAAGHGALQRPSVATSPVATPGSRWPREAVACGPCATGGRCATRRSSNRAVMEGHRRRPVAAGR